ncbi:MAG TPA: hypothetical protein DCZ95_13600 [Verrucomicrobia bacterium]|nr:MAG: hypothetical protein A2X46_19170 [Lentisphaerae bacterium GWF2_57_35]HBA85119.1 hypothetical protein [Verrucomicrobiota bacterium]
MTPKTVVLICSVVCAVPIYADQVEVVDTQGGRMTWTTDAANAISVYTVEWAPSLEGSAWQSSWSSLSGIETTNQIVTVDIPMFYRVSGYSYREESDPAVLRQMYVNAVRDASNATPEKITRHLFAVHPSNPDIVWRTNSSGVKEIKVVSFMSQWAAMNFYQGHTNITASEQWVTIYPEMYNFCRNYKGTNQLLRIKQVLGMPPWSGNDTMVEFWVDPNFLFRPSPDPEIYDHEANAEFYTNAFSYMSTMSVSPDYFHWYTNTFNTRHYDMPGDNPTNSWPWTRLGYTYDWGQPSNHVGLSEYVIPDKWLWPWPGTNKNVAMEVAFITNAASYGK